MTRRNILCRTEKINKPLISQEHSVRVEHRNYLEHNKLSETDCDIMRGDEEVKKTLDDEGGWSFSWVNPGHDEHNLNLLLILILVVNIFPVGKYLKFRKVMRLKILYLPVTQVVRARNRDQIYWFLKHSLPQGFFVNIIKLS